MTRACELDSRANLHAFFEEQLSKINLTGYLWCCNEGVSNSICGNITYEASDHNKLYIVLIQNLDYLAGSISLMIITATLAKWLTLLLPVSNPCNMAKSKGSWPSPFTVLTSAPHSSSSFVSSGFPILAAKCNGVFPCSSLVSICAPLISNSDTKASIYKSM